MTTKILMPALSPTMIEGTINNWLVKIGDKVKAGDIIAEIETDKATMEVEAVDEGVITHLLEANPNKSVLVNSVIALIDGGEKDVITNDLEKKEKPKHKIDKKYNTEFCLFETTSLYGNIKGASMYDGMRPYLKYKGDTTSSFLLTMGDDIYPELRKWFEEKNEGPLVKKTASSRKLKTQTKMIGMVKASLKEHDTTKYNEFCECIKTATGVTTQKRFYMSDYGYANSKDVLTGKTDVLVKSESFEKYSLENIIKWWKKKATKRYEKLKTEGRNRHELEYWNAESIDKIDIIR